MKLTIASIGLLAMAQTSGAVAAVYSNDFQTSVGSEWSTTFAGGLALDSTVASAGRMFLGRADGNPTLGNSNDVLKLSLSGLAAHDKVTVSFDVYVLNSWDGNGPLGNFPLGPFGPDLFGVTIAGAAPGTVSSFITTFSNLNGGEAGSDPIAGVLQSYPGPFPTLPGSAPFSGALEVGTLGYDFFGGGPGDDDSVYRLSLTFAHSDSSLALSFFGSGLQDLSDESWGLDNMSVDVNAVPLPAPVALLATSFVSLLAARRRKA